MKHKSRPHQHRRTCSDDDGDLRCIDETPCGITGRQYNSARNGGMGQHYVAARFTLSCICLLMRNSVSCKEPSAMHVRASRVMTPWRTWSGACPLSAGWCCWPGFAARPARSHISTGNTCLHNVITHASIKAHEMWHHTQLSFPTLPAVSPISLHDRSKCARLKFCGMNALGSVRKDHVGSCIGQTPTLRRLQAPCHKRPH